MYPDLIEQAEHLVYLDPGKPKQANLRRAVSAAYYALFHYLVLEACRTQMDNVRSSPKDPIGCTKRQRGEKTFCGPLSVRPAS